MRSSNTLLFTITIFVLLLFFYRTGAAADNPARYKQILLKIPAFTINPGETIVGVEITLVGGRITQFFPLRGWRCNIINNLRANQLYYCSSSHSAYAITNSAKLPTLSIDDMSSAGGMTFGIEAHIELEKRRWTAIYEATERI